MLKPVEYTLAAVLERSAKRFTGLPALSRLGGIPYSFERVRELALDIAASLRARGIGKGDRVAILSENRPEWGIAYLAVVSMGAVAVPILVDFSPAQVGSILEHSGAKAVFTSNRLAKKVESVSAGVARLNLDADFESLTSPSGGAPVVRAVTAAGGAPSARPDEARRGGAAPAGEGGVSPDDLAAVIYTSGTTGSSKGVALTHRNLVFETIATRRIIRLGPRDRLLSILPLAHVYECTLGFLLPFAQGAVVYYLDRAPTAQVLLPALAAVRPTVMLSVPLVIEKMVRNKVFPELEKTGAYRNALLKPIVERVAGMKMRRVFGNRLRFFGVGGAALAPDVEAVLKRSRFPYAIGYGLTETSPLVAGCNARHTVLRSTGPALPSVDLRIADPNPATGEGEIQVRGPNVMLGYYRDEARTKEAFTEDGWFKTGDLGAFDDRGRLYIRGRLKNVILGPSGENIYPEEIEAALNSFEGVEESLVYEEDSGGLVALVYFEPAFRQRVVAEVYDQLDRVEDAAANLLDRIRKEVNAKLTAFSRLGKVFEHPEPFEKTPSQKIKRFLYPDKLRQD